MKKVLLVFCVIVGVANGDTYMSTNMSCRNALSECMKKYMVESYEKAIQFCQPLYFSCKKNNRIMLEKQKSELAAKQAAQQEQARYAKCRNGNADACFDIGYE